MHLQPTAAVLLFYATISVRALLPLRTLEELGEGFLSVSTELTLGRDWENSNVGSEIRPHASPLGHHPLQPGEGTSQSSMHGEEHTLPWQQFQPPSQYHDPQASIASTTSSLPSHSPITAGADTSQTTDLTDRFFSELIKDPRTKKMKLPHDWVYVKSPWLTPVYRNMIQEFLGRPWTRELELDVPEAWIARQLSEKQKFFRTTTPVYKLQLEPGTWGSRESRELILRYHTNLRWAERVKINSVMTIWSTTEHGSRLALLGVYHSVRSRLSADFLKYLGVERYSPVMRRGSKLKSIYLMPQETP